MQLPNKNELDQWYKVFKHGIHHWIVPEKVDSSCTAMD